MFYLDCKGILHWLFFTCDRFFYFSVFLIIKDTFVFIVFGFQMFPFYFALIYENKMENIMVLYGVFLMKFWIWQPKIYRFLSLLFPNDSKWFQMINKKSGISMIFEKKFVSITENLEIPFRAYQSITIFSQIYTRSIFDKTKMDILDYVQKRFKKNSFWKQRFFKFEIRDFTL